MCMYVQYLCDEYVCVLMRIHLRMCMIHRMRMYVYVCVYVCDEYVVVYVSPHPLP